MKVVSRAQEFDVATNEQTDFKLIRKRNGELARFDASKITNAIRLVTIHSAGFSEGVRL